MTNPLDDLNGLLDQAEGEMTAQSRLQREPPALVETKKRLLTELEAARPALRSTTKLAARLLPTVHRAHNLATRWRDAGLSQPVIWDVLAACSELQMLLETLPGRIERQPDEINRLAPDFDGVGKVYGAAEIAFTIRSVSTLEASALSEFEHLTALIGRAQQRGLRGTERVVPITALSDRNPERQITGDAA